MYESSNAFFWFQFAHWVTRVRIYWSLLGVSELLRSSLCLYAGANPSRPGGFPGANSPGPVADLYGPSSQDSAVGNYISAASPQPGSGFGPSITVSTKILTAPRASSSALKLDAKKNAHGLHLQHSVKQLSVRIKSSIYSFTELTKNNHCRPLRKYPGKHFCCCQVQGSHNNVVHQC